MSSWYEVTGSLKCVASDGLQKAVDDLDEAIPSGCDGTIELVDDTLTFTVSGHMSHAEIEEVDRALSDFARVHAKEPTSISYNYEGEQGIIDVGPEGVDLVQVEIDRLRAEIAERERRIAELERTRASVAAPR